MKNITIFAEPSYVMEAVAGLAVTEPRLTSVSVVHGMVQDTKRSVLAAFTPAKYTDVPLLIAEDWLRMKAVSAVDVGLLHEVPPLVVPVNCIAVLLPVSKRSSASEALAASMMLAVADAALCVRTLTQLAAVPHDDVQRKT